MKVFVVIEQSNYEFDVDITTKVFATRKSATDYWEDRVELALNNAEDAMDEDELVVDRDDERLSFDVYKDGRASEWETNIWVEEKEVIEEEYDPKYIYTIGILDADDNELDEVNIAANSEEEMWKIFDKEHKDCVNSIIYDRNLA